MVQDGSWRKEWKVKHNVSVLGFLEGTGGGKDDQDDFRLRGKIFGMGCWEISSRL